MFKDGDEDLLNCGPANNDGIVVNADEAGFEAMYSLILTTYMSGEPIRSLRIRENTSDCELSYVLGRRP